MHASLTTWHTRSNEPVVIGRGHQRRVDVTLVRGSIADVSARAIVLGLFKNVDASGAAKAIDDRLGGIIGDVLRSRMFSPDAGAIFVLPTGRTPLRAEFVVLAGLGTFDRFGPAVIEMVCSHVATTLVRANVEEFATILLGGNSGQDVAACTTHLLRGVLAGIRDVDANQRFRNLSLVEIDESRFHQIREETYNSCRTDFCSDFEIALRTVEADVSVGARTAAKPTGAAASGRTSSVYLLVRTERFTTKRLTLRVAALTAGANAALLDDRVEVDLVSLRATLAEIERPGFDHSRLEKVGRTVTQTVLPARVRTELRKCSGHQLTLVHDHEASVIPWEVIRLPNWIPALDAGMSRRYLMDDVAVARWSEERRMDPELRILVVMNPTGDLSGAEQEGKRIAKLASTKPRIRVESLRGRQATADAVLAALRSEQFDVIHYAGHAMFSRDAPGQSGVACSDRTLRAVELFNLRKLPALLFFNACESARTRRRGAIGVGAAKTLADSAGFAEALMRAGVANYIGTYWPVGDSAANSFSAGFYEAILAGESLGAALLMARRLVHRLKSVDWADYIHYGDYAFELKPALRTQHRVRK